MRWDPLLFYFNLSCLANEKTSVRCPLTAHPSLSELNYLPILLPGDFLGAQPEKPAFPEPYIHFSPQDDMSWL